MKSIKLFGLMEMEIRKLFIGIQSFENLRVSFSKEERNLDCWQIE